MNLNSPNLTLATPLHVRFVIYFWVLISGTDGRKIQFTKSGKFRLHITSLEYLSQYARHKVWVKQSAEMSFLYGNHVTKGGLARMTENTPQYAGVVVYNMSDIPMGFGVAAQSTEYSRQLEATSNVVLHQADIGDYLRGLEDDVF